MNLLNIRKQANALALKNATKLVPIFIMVELILLSLMMVSNQILSMLLSLLFSTITHAYIVISLKAVEQQPISIRKDSLAGIVGYGRLFPSYVMKKIIVNLVSIVLLIPTIYLIYSKTSFMMGDLLTWLQFIIVSGIEDLTMLSTMYEYLTSPIVIVSFIVAIAISIIISFGLAMMPYLVEKQEISWNEAILKSWRMMKGHKKELFVLRLSYLPQMVLIMVTIPLVSSLLSFSLYLSTFTTLFLSLYLPIMLYQPHLEIANALFYKELINQEEHPDLFIL